MAWACHSNDHNLAIAANIFLYAGVILLYIINLVFTERVLRAQHPHFGWSKPISIAFIVVFAITAATVITQIASVVAGFFSTDPYCIYAMKSVQKYGSTMMAFVASLPLFIVSASSLARKHPHIRMTKTTDKFGEGSMRGKVVTVLVASLFLLVSAWFRAGVILADEATPRGSRPGYLSKACFYVFIFMIEILVIAFWLLLRIDKRFYIPDGARGPFSYAGGFVFAGEVGNEKGKVNGAPRPSQQQENRQSMTGSIGSNSGRSGRPSSLVPDQAISVIGAQAQDLNDPPGPLPHRASWAGSVKSTRSVISTKSMQERRAAKQLALERRVSWGGVSRSDVQDSTDEAGKVLRYQAFADSWTGGDTAADVGVEGVEREMGFDPESGQWVVRPVSSAPPGSARPDEEEWYT